MEEQQLLMFANMPLNIKFHLIVLVLSVFLQAALLLYLLHLTIRLTTAPILLHPFMLTKVQSLGQQSHL
jgi:hypothetical protein